MEEQDDEYRLDDDYGYCDNADGDNDCGDNDQDKVDEGILCGDKPDVMIRLDARDSWMEAMATLTDSEDDDPVGISSLPTFKRKTGEDAVSLVKTSFSSRHQICQDASREVVRRRLYLNPES